MNYFRQPSVAKTTQSNFSSQTTQNQIASSVPFGTTPTVRSNMQPGLLRVDVESLMRNPTHLEQYNNTADHRQYYPATPSSLTMSPECDVKRNSELEQISRNNITQLNSSSPYTFDCQVSDYFPVHDLLQAPTSQYQSQNSFVVNRLPTPNVQHQLSSNINTLLAASMLPSPDPYPNSVDVSIPRSSTNVSASFNESHNLLSLNDTSINMQVEYMQNTPKSTSIGDSHQITLASNVYPADQGTEYKHVCTVCFKRLSTASNLRSHMKIHSREKPFQCLCCGRSFARKADLSTHQRVHTREKPFECSKCQKKFTQSGSYNRHKKRCTMRGGIEAFDDAQSR
ncbi:hypothetical protein BKA69DRAFT_1078914 [Paraphysoderma sedebokerense]|nr:hypothetical protein BKA69DRAFT_1078914 [Paraphysoderma sedebokerense]